MKQSIRSAIYIPPESSEIALTALKLAALFSRLALEKRTLLRHPDGRQENVAEHSEMLALIAPVIAEQYYPKLDANLVCRFAVLHDTMEAYVGDVSTHYMDEKALKMKDKEESRAIETFKEDFSDSPHLTDLIRQYETQTLPEARFVRLLDKWMPILLHYTDEGATLRSYTTSSDLVKEYVPRANRLRTQFPDFTELVGVREELTKLAAKHLF